MAFGLRELVLVITAAVIVWPYSRVLSRLGFSPWLGVLVFVPVVNIIALWLFAYAKWPALREPSSQLSMTRP
jgi:hypothetical protein